MRTQFVQATARVVATLLLIATSAAALAQYPDRPVRIVNPFAVGGSGDNIQRLFAQRLSEHTGKTFIVEPKTGAGGRIAYDYVAKSRADGYTLVGADPGYSVLGALYGKLPWDHANDFVPVTMYARAPFAILVSPQSRFKTLTQLLEYARANPGKVTYGSPGTGTIGHFVMELVQREANVTLTHVPYKGGSEALVGLMGNNIDLMVTGAPTVTGQVKNGSVVVLALTSQSRWAGAEHIPTLAEQGVNVTTYLWFGLMAPRGTPQAVVDYLHQQVVSVLEDPKTKEALQLQGVQGVGMAPADLGRLLRDDTKAWTQVVQAAKITAE